MTKQEHLTRYEAARLRINDARHVAGLEDNEAEAVRIGLPMDGDGETTAAVLICWRCEESTPADDSQDEFVSLLEFWVSHRKCVTEDSCGWPLTSPDERWWA